MTLLHAIGWFIAAPLAQEVAPLSAPDPHVAELEALRAELAAHEGARKASAEEIARLRAAWEAASVLFDDRLPRADRVAASKRLAEAADAKAVPLLRSAARDRDPAVARGALTAAATLPGRPGVVELAADVLHDARLDESVRAAAVAALGEMQQGPAAEALWKAAGDTEGVPTTLRRLARETVVARYPALVAERGGPPSTGTDRVGAAAVVLGNGAAAGVLLHSVGTWGQSEAAQVIGAVGGGVVGLGTGAAYVRSEMVTAGQGLRYASNVGLGVTAAALTTNLTFGSAASANYTAERAEARKDVGALFRALGAAGGAGAGVVAARYDPSASDVVESDLAAILLGQTAVGIADLAVGVGFEDRYCNLTYGESPLEAPQADCTAADHLARAESGAALVGGVAGLGLAGVTRQRWDLSGPELGLATVGGVEGLWAATLLPVIADGDRPEGALRTGFYGAAALSLGLGQLTAVDVHRAAVTTWGLALGNAGGAALPLLFDAPDSVVAGVTLPAGLAGGVLGALAAPSLPFSGGDRQMVAVGTGLSLAEGLAVGSILADYDILDGGDQVAGMTLGAATAGGLALTAATRDHDPSRERVTFLGTATAWGAWYGALVPVSADADERAVLLSTTLSADAFFGAGLWATSASGGLDPARTTLPQLCGVGGATLGALGAAMATADGQSVALGAVAGSTVGIVAGAVVESRRPPPNKRHRTASFDGSRLDLPGDWSGALAPTVLEDGAQGVYGSLRVTGW